MIGLVVHSWIVRRAWCLLSVSVASVQTHKSIGCLTTPTCSYNSPIMTGTIYLAVKVVQLLLRRS